LQGFQKTNGGFAMSNIKKEQETDTILNISNTSEETNTNNALIYDKEFIALLKADVKKTIRELTAKKYLVKEEKNSQSKNETAI
jgi:hypothetical protein